MMVNWIRHFVYKYYIDKESVLRINMSNFVACWSFLCQKCRLFYL